MDIATNDAEAMKKAYDWIQGICAVPEVGKTYHGKIVSILEFGAFVEILPGKEGLLHVSEIAWNKTENVEDVLAVGQEVDVKLLEIDQKTGKMRLSMRALLPKPEGYVEPTRRPRGNGGGNGGERRPGGNERHGNGGERRNGGNERHSGGNDRRNGGERKFGQRNNNAPKPEASNDTTEEYF